MKIKYLGTAAYEGIPALFCECETCKKSLKLGGKNLRTRSQALINDDLLIDFNCDTLSHYYTYKMDWNKIRNCLITHSHDDHLYISDIMQLRGHDFSHPNDDYSITFHAGLRSFKMLGDAFVLKGVNSNVLKNHFLEPFKEYQIASYKVIPLPANHDFTSSPYIYYIEKDDKKMVYGHDSGFFFEDVIDKLRTLKPLNFISLDCTGALLKGWRDNHMSLDVNIELINRLKEEGIIDDKTIIVSNHFSHNGKATYEGLAKAAKPFNIIISYDGMEIEF